MYSFNSIIIAAILFVCIIIANELGLYAGIYYGNKSDEDIKSQTTAIQGGIIGLLALILGFSFSMAIQRYDNRGAAEIAEANAIGTAQLRTSLLPSPYDAEAKRLLREYIDLRLTVNQTDLTEKDIRRTYKRKTVAVQEQIWDTALKAAEVAPNPVTTGYFVAAINDMIDAEGKRNDQLLRHVPSSIFYLLFTIFIATSALTGYASGLGRRNSRIPAIILSFMVCLLVFIIVDLDRPRRGIIEVKQDSMENLIK